MMVQPSAPHLLFIRLITSMSQFTDCSPLWNRDGNLQRQQLYFSSLITIRTVAAQLNWLMLVLPFSFLYG